MQLLGKAGMPPVLTMSPNIHPLSVFRAHSELGSLAATDVGARGSRSLDSRLHTSDIQVNRLVN